VTTAPATWALFSRHGHAIAVLRKPCQFFMTGRIGEAIRQRPALLSPGVPALRARNSRPDAVVVLIPVGQECRASYKKKPRRLAGLSFALALRGRGTSAGRQFWPRGIVPRHSPVWRQIERKSPGLLRHRASRWIP